jgi:hypothetical protein
MHIPARLACGFRKLAHQRQDRIADDLRLLPKRFVIDLDGAGGCIDRRGGVTRYDIHAGLGTSQRGLRLEIAPDKGLVREHRAHLRRAEHVTKEGGIETVLVKIRALQIGDPGS